MPVIAIVVVAALATAVKRYQRRTRRNTANVLAQLKTHRRAAAVANPASLTYDQSRFVTTTDRALQRTVLANPTYGWNEEETVYQDGDEPLYMDAVLLDGGAGGVGGDMLDAAPYDTVEKPQLHSAPSDDSATEVTQVCSASDGGNDMEVTGDDGTSEQFAQLAATGSPALVQTAAYGSATERRALELANPTYHFCDGSAEVEAVYQDGDGAVYMDAVRLEGGVGNANVVHAAASDDTGPSAYAHLTARYSTHRTGPTGTELSYSRRSDDGAHDHAGPGAARSTRATAAPASPRHHRATAKLFLAGAKPRKPPAYVNGGVTADGVVPALTDDSASFYGEVSDGDGIYGDCAEPGLGYLDVGCG